MTPSAPFPWAAVASGTEILGRLLRATMTFDPQLTQIHPAALCCNRFGPLFSLAERKLVYTGTDTYNMVLVAK